MASKGPVTPYPKGDLRRMLSVLGAVSVISSSASIVAELLGETNAHSLLSENGATANQISSLCGLDRKTIYLLLEQAQLEAGIVIQKNGSAFKIKDWGETISISGCITALIMLFKNQPWAMPDGAIEKLEQAV